ncbi:MAG: thiosulfate oxidation carrier protein SoxY [Betaproteobacteria bacterium]
MSERFSSALAFGGAVATPLVGRRAVCSAVLASAAGFGGAARAQGMFSGTLLSLPQMLNPIVQGASLREGSITLELPVLADNGLLVPVRVAVDSPMTEQDHVTHVYLLSQRNPVTRMAVFHMGPWTGRAEVSTRLRLAGSQKVVALARLSDGSFRWRQADVIVTESACVDGT